LSGLFVPGILRPVRRGLFGHPILLGKPPAKVSHPASLAAERFPLGVCRGAAAVHAERVGPWQTWSFYQESGRLSAIGWERRPQPSSAVRHPTREPDCRGPSAVHPPDWTLGTGHGRAPPSAS